MSIIKWYETDVTIKQGQVLTYNVVNPGANIIQLINRTASGGGNVFADNKVSNVSSALNCLRIEQGKTGNIVRPYGIQVLYLASDAAADLRVTVIEVQSSDLSVVYNASQIVQIQGQVQVAEPVTVDGTVNVGGSVEISNDSGNPIPVSGTMTIDTINGSVEITNDAGNPIPVNGTVDVGTLPTITPAGKTAIKVTAGAAGDQTVKAAAGVVYDVVTPSAGVTILVKDAATERWKVSDTARNQPGAPITCGTSIILNFSGAGDAYIIYE